MSQEDSTSTPPAETPLKRLTLESRHEALGGQLVPFAGWLMPVQFAGIVAEHEAVRQRVGLFDVSHMGEARVMGADATRWLSRVIAHDPASLAIGQALYTVMCREDGGIVDDLIVYRMAEQEYFLCINAACIDGDLAHLRGHLDDALDVSLTDESAAWMQLAVQGPRAEALMQTLTDAPLDQLKRFHIQRVIVAGVGLLIARTGYTGEDGFELYIPHEYGPAVFDAIVAAGEAFGLAPCGLGARDVLRLEAKMLLYGQDIDLTTSPLEAGLNWVIRWDKPEPFVGQAALEAQRDAGLTRRLRCLTLEGKGVLRPGYTLWHDDAQVGVLTSGTYSPTLGASIALGYVDASALKQKTLDVQIRKKRQPARVSTKPFYTRPS